MGSEEKYVFLEMERPKKVYVDEFSISKYSVTISEFNEFIKETNYATDAENLGGFCFFEQFEKEIKMSSPNAPWWIKVENANWNLPDGENIESIIFRSSCYTYFMEGRPRIL